MGLLLKLYVGFKLQDAWSIGLAADGTEGSARDICSDSSELHTVQHVESISLEPGWRI